MTYALRAYEYWVFSYRRVWRGSVVTTALNPVLYLSALGIGLGKLVNRGPGLGVPLPRLRRAGDPRFDGDAGRRVRVRLMR